MKAFRSLFLLLILTTLAVICRGQDNRPTKPTLNIEAAMRAWQERWVVLTGADQIFGESNPNGYKPIAWPARKSDGLTPGPYPVDCFYAVDMQDPTRAAVLVSNFVSAVAISMGQAGAPGGFGAIRRFDPLWASWSSPPPTGPNVSSTTGGLFRWLDNGNWAIRNTSSAPWSSDFGSVTLSNYEAKFQTVVDHWLNAPCRVLWRFSSSSGADYNWTYRVARADYADCVTCTACKTGQCIGGGCVAQLEGSGLDFTITLGQGSQGDLGSLQIHEEVPSQDLSTPYKLAVRLKARVYNTGGGAGGVVNSEGYSIYDDSTYPVKGYSLLRQIVLPQGLVDIVPEIGDPSYSYTIYFYDKDHRGTLNSGSRFYLVNPADAYKTVKIENPDRAVAFNRLKITASTGQSYLYVFTAATIPGRLAGSWSLSNSSVASEVLEQSWISGTGDAIGDIRQEIHKTTDAFSGSVAAKSRNKYQIFPWNADSATLTPFTSRGRRDEMIEEVVNPDVGGKQITTTYHYYDDVPSSSPNYSRLKQVEYSDGSWARYEYDSQGRVTRSYTPYRDSTAPAIAAGTFIGDCRLTETSYGTAPSQTITDSIVSAGVSYIVSRNFQDIDDTSSLYSVIKNARATTSIAAYSDPSNLLTITRTLKTGNFIGSPERIVNPDGTITLYTYSYVQGGNSTVVEARGTPNTASPLTATDIVTGTRTTRVTNAQGQEVSRATVDVASGLITENTTYFNFDAYGRWQSSLDLTGHGSARTYDCCGLSASTTPAGVRTNYAYDALRRVTRETRYLAVSNVAMSDVGYTYDPAGRLLSTTRYSVGTSADSTTPTSIILETTEYNLAGQRISSTTPDGKTLIDETTASGHRVVSATYADSSTQVQTFRSDGTMLSVSGSAVAPINYDVGVDTNGYFTLTTKIGEAGATTEWSKEYVDFAGRSAKTVLADETAATRTYNGKGQLASMKLPPDSGSEGTTTLYFYNPLGQLETTVVDLNHDGVVDYNGMDRITKTVQDATESIHDGVSYVVFRAITSVWAGNGVDAASVINTAESAVDGIHTWQNQNGLTTTSMTILSGDGVRKVTTTAPDGTQNLQIFSADRLVTSILSAASVQRSRVDLGYDGHGRVESSTDARNGKTRYTFFNDDHIKQITSPDPDLAHTGAGYDPQITQFTYDTMGRQSTQTLPDGGMVNFRYWPTGQLKRTWGARTYAQQTTYDSQGRLRTLATWSGFTDESSFDTTTGRSITTWNYNPQRGWLDNKRYNDNTGPSYLYYPSGQLKQRTWARGTYSTYVYSAAGEISEINYSDATPAVSITYDRLGRAAQVIDAAGKLITGYQGNTVLPTDETYSEGILSGSVLNRSYDGLFRPSLMTLPNANYNLGFSYRDGSRLDTLSSIVNSVALAHAYTYQPNSDLISSLVQKQGAATVLTTIRNYDLLGRLSAIIATPTSGLNVSATYGYNDANQRTTATDADGKFWAYSYDALGQVTGGTKKLSDGTALFGHVLNYTFDTIGNRLTSTANSASTTYTADSNGLNQYQSRNVPGLIDITGSADAAANVIINLLPAERQADVFHTQLSVNNAGNAVLQPVSIVAAKPGAGSGGTDAVQKQSGNVFVAATPENFGYDADGNLVSDGRWTYAWDAENRLAMMEAQSAAVTAGVAKQKLEFAYDAQGRRIQKKVSNWNGTAYVVASDSRFIYDGWNMLAELNGLGNNAVVGTYVWGLDLSGSSQGAGGVGGLLAIGNASGTYAPTFDGNGNIVSLINAQDGTTAAEYAYGPFGEVIKAAGVAVGNNPFGFSTKYQDAESGLLYYGVRYYQPQTGRWLSRDPLGETGGNNMYGFIGNDGVDLSDLLGLARNGSGHTYQTYLAVAFVLGQPDARARYLTAYASMPDSLKSRTAYAPGLPAFKAFANFISGGMFFPGFDRIQRYLHSLDGGDPVARRNCLSKLLGRDDLKPWQEGFLIHALGDAYFHVGKDGKLYVAPFGHAEDSVSGNDPDQILLGDQRQTKLAPFLRNLTATLNRGALDSAQQGRLDQLLGEIGALPGVDKSTDATGRTEDDVFRKLAVSHGYGTDGYLPADGLSTKDYLKRYGNDNALPSDADVQQFLKLIKCNCSK